MDDKEEPKKPTGAYQEALAEHGLWPEKISKLLAGTELETMEGSFEPTADQLPPQNIVPFKKNQS
jgi:hypothetical protein